MALKVSIITPVKATKPHHLTWLNEAIASVAGQSAIQDCEMIVVDDHSTIDLSPVKAQWDRIRWLEAESSGVSAARNQAADAARAPLLLPLDGDDKLAVNAVEQFLRAWNDGGEAEGIVYSDIIMFGKDYQQVYLAPGYDFKYLLQTTFMVVGCLHRKADWECIGGWRSDMDIGLEDWEYWIALAEIGVCGYHIEESLYWYRRNPGGRLAAIKSGNTKRYQQAKLRMRDLHRDVYDGRYPVRCCGGDTPRGGNMTIRQRTNRPSILQAGQMEGDRVPVVYTGRRQGSFNVIGQGGMVYVIGGRNAVVEDTNGKIGVLQHDVRLFQSFNQGSDFRVVQSKPPVPPPVPVAPKPMPSPTAAASYDPAMAVDEPIEIPAGTYQEKGIPDPTELTVKEIQSLSLNDLTSEQAYVMLSIEQSRVDRKPRVGVVKHLAKLAA